MILAKKKNMTQVFEEGKRVVPVTILDFSECFVQKGLKKSGNFLAIGKERNPGKARLGIFGDGNVPKYEMPVDEEMTELPTFEEGFVVDVVSISKGKGFAGVVKRYKFKGGKRTHGQSDRQRHPGSIGAGTTPGRVFKGKRMGGRMGSEKVTVKGLKVVSVDNENKLMVLKGSVPGRYDSIVEVYKR